MPPKQATPTTTVFVVVHSNGKIDSIHATSDSANTTLYTLDSAKIEEHTLVRGSVLPDSPAVPAKAPTKSKAAAARSAPKATTDESGGGDDEDEPPAKKAPAKKAAGAAGAAGAAAKPAKNAVEESSLPENVQALLDGSGTQFAGMSIVVTGVPEMLGRKNAEKLVTNYGGSIVKTVSKKTRYVVLGKDAGPKKLEQIQDLMVETLSEEQLIKFLETSVLGGGDSKNGGGAKRVGSGDGEKITKKKR